MLTDSMILMIPTYEDFILSAWASAPVFSRSEELSVGQLILEGVRAAQHMVSCNTNLGILLLLAPLAKAALISSVRCHSEIDYP